MVSLKSRPNNRNSYGTNMKLIIQIPCYNEQETLNVALEHLPRHVEGFECVEWLVIDDGSTDGSWNKVDALSQSNGRIRGIRFNRNFGKSAALHVGFQHCEGKTFKGKILLAFK